MAIAADKAYMAFKKKKKKMKQQKQTRQASSHTFVKSVGHHTTEVTSSLWPWSVMGGRFGSEI